MPLPRHRWFNHWLTARGTRLVSLVCELAAAVDAHEQALGSRKRARRADDQRSHDATLEATVSNLALAILDPPPTGRLAILTGNRVGKRSRYDHAAFGKGFRSLLGSLEAMGAVEWAGSNQRGEASSLAPTAAFRMQAQRAGLRLGDFGQSDEEETIILTRKDRQEVADGWITLKHPVDYPDTASTIAMRDELGRQNAFLAAADIGFVDDGLGVVNPFDRRQTRRFVVHDDDAPRFDLGGRFFGGFWQNLKGSRRGGIRIAGERIAVVDYSSMFSRLAYARASAVPPPGDLYAVPGLEGHRKALKRAFNTLLFDTHNRRQEWPAEFTAASDGHGQCRAADEVLPAEWSVSRVRKAVLRHHPALKGSLGMALGYELMFKESQVLSAVLAHMRERGIVGLGLHDGLIVPRSAVEDVVTIMGRTSGQKSGVELPVAVTATP